MDAGRTHKNPRSEKKNFIVTTITVARVQHLHQFPEPLFPQWHKEGQVMRAHTAGCDMGEKPQT